ncbi:MAG: 8-amino-7-oxononanoate synthase [Candidatus Midichloriaceae bacterium]|jgi:8-amino-7-oxononanoate synthase
MKYKSYIKFLKNLHDTLRYRELPESINCDEGFLDFSNNDYLKFSNNSEIINHTKKITQEYNVGSTGSRLLSGNQKIFEILEKRIAQDKKTEASLVFNSGFQANTSTLSSLIDKKVLGERPIVFFDRLNHASLYQAVFMSDVELVRYKHNDIEHLSQLLGQYKDDDRAKFIVTETLFGMDGDLLPIEDICHLAKIHKAFLYLDESHATGVIGEDGYGLSTNVDLSEIPHVVMGTFSKALGCSGGYIACDKVIKEYLINKAQGLIYSTAPSPLLMGIVLKAWELVKNFSKERESLMVMAKNLRYELNNMGYDTGNSETHIVPIIVKNEEDALKIKEKLFSNKIIVSCIRPPTVPIGTSRIRIALNVGHFEDEIKRLIGVLRKT